MQISGRILRNEAGISSLIGVIIAGAILMTIVLATTKMITGSQAGAKSLSATLAANEVMEEIKLLLSDPAACNQSFGTAPPTQVNNNPPSTVSDLKDGIGNIIFDTVIAPTNVLKGGLLTLNKIEVGGPLPTGYFAYDPLATPNRGSTRLLFTFKENDPSKPVAQQKNILREIRMDTTINGGFIVQACQYSRTALVNCVTAPAGWQAGAPPPTTGISPMNCPAGHVVYGSHYAITAGTPTDLSVAVTRTSITATATGATTGVNLLCCRELF